MQVKLITIVESIIDIDPEANPSFEEARTEILGRLTDNDEGDLAEDLKSAHSEAVIFDSIRAQSVTHKLEVVE